MEHFTEEFETSDKPTLLLYCQKHELTDLLINHYKKDFKIIFLSPNKPTKEYDDSVYVLSISSAYLLGKLVESIAYAIFFAESQSKTIFSTLVDTFTRDKTKIALLVEREQADDLDVIPDLKQNLLVNIIFLGDVIVPKVYKNSNEISKFVTGAILSKQITISENDSYEILPIIATDVISGINYCLFGHYSKQEFFYLFYSKPKTYAAAAYLLKKIEPEILVTLTQEKSDPPEEPFKEYVGKLVEDKYYVKVTSIEQPLDGFEKGVEKMIEKHEFGEEKESSSPFFAVIKKAKDKTPRKIPYFSQFFAGIIIFLLFEVLCIALSYYFFTNSFKNAQENNIAASLTEFENAQNFLILSRPLITISLPIVNLIKSDNTISEKLSLLNDAAQLTKTKSLSNNLNQTDGFASVTKNSLDSYLTTATYLYLNLEKVGIEDNNSKLLNLLSGNLSTVASLSPILEDLLGFSSPKKYLLLFQNNGELRPTGGFIGSVGEISLSNSKTTDIKIQDVYDLDGQLKAHVEPYYIVRRFLQPNLYLRDSNFDMNFQNSASTSALLYHLEGGAQVDGVVGIDFEVLKQIVGVVGPLTLDGYNITVDKNSLFDFLEKTIQTNAQTGSAEKKNVLSEVENQIELKLEQNPNLYFKILKLIPNLLSQKHILFAFDDKSIENVFSALDLSDDYTDFRNTANLIPDVLSVNEANIGVNKANSKVTRTVMYDATLNSGQYIISKLTLYINNTDPDSEDYKTYIRILAPLSSNLNSIAINGVEQKIVPAVTDYSIYEAKNFKAPVGFEVDKMSFGPYQTFGFITTVDARSNQTIMITYQNGLTIPKSAYYIYSLLYFKQPGTETYPLVVNVNPDPEFSAQNQTYIKSTADSDKTFSIPFLQKQ